MATGILGQATPVAATLTTVYTVPAAKVATFNVSIVNTSAVQVLVRLAIASTNTPTASEYIEYDTLLGVNEIIERTGIVANAAEKVIIYASIAGVSVSVYGYEE